MSLLIFILAFAVQGAPVADDPQLLAQAQDRCMTTYAVRQAAAAGPTTPSTRRQKAAAPR